MDRVAKYVIAVLALASMVSSVVSGQGDGMSCSVQGGVFDLKCLMKSSQYTITGTVLSTDLTVNSTTRYNALVSVKCAWTSFSNPLSTFVNLVGSTINITGFGTPNSVCNPSSLGADAIPGATQIFTIYVFQSANNVNPVTLYRSTSLCAGRFDNTTATLQTVSNVYTAYSANRMANVGPTATCLQALPSPIPIPTAETSPSGGGANSSDSPSSSVDSSHMANLCLLALTPLIMCIWFI